MKKGPKWKLQDLKIIDVRKRSDFQNRVNGTDQSHIKKLLGELEAGKDLPPIEIAQVGKALYVIEGFHRLEAHCRAEHETINCKVARMTLQEAKDRALLSNTKHGKNLSRADKASIWQRYLDEQKHHWSDTDHMPPHCLAGQLKSSRVISADLNHIYSHETIRTKLKDAGLQLDDATEFPNGYKAQFDEESEAELAAERIEDATTALWNFESLYQSLDEEHQKSLLREAERIIGAIQNGKRPERIIGRSMEALLDI